MPQPNSIFISYRRTDSQDLTGRIYEYLANHFGAEAVFRDVYSLPMGEDYRVHLKEKAQNCQVLVAVMGPDWVTVEDKDGTRRLDNPNDWVRVEVATALDWEIPVIPLLINGARVPKEDDLPGDLKPIAHRNAALARPDPDFQHDMERLIRQLENVVNRTDRQPKLRRRQQLELDYATTRLADLEKLLLRVQKELAANGDVVTVSKLEKRQLMLLDEIDAVDEEIQQLESANE